MLISTKGRYALRMLVDLAEHQGDGLVPLKEIAQRQEISEKYLEVILKTLVKNNVLVGVRGKGGGYRLSKPPELFTVRQILEYVGEDIHPVACVGTYGRDCMRMANCRTLPMWQELDTLLCNFFEGKTLASLMAQAEAGNDYVI